MADLPNQCLGCGRPISWSRWFCNFCAKEEGLTVEQGLAPSKPKRKSDHSDGDESLDPSGYDPDDAGWRRRT